MMTTNPFKELSRLQHELDRMIHSAFGTDEFDRWRNAFLPGHSARMYPKINLYDDHDHFYVEALAPGIDPEKIEVSIADNNLTVSGEKVAHPNGVKPEAFHRNERSTGRFVRTIEIPSRVDTNNISAEYKNGILLITLPKAEEAKPKAIEVKLS